MRRIVSLSLAMLLSLVLFSPVAAQNATPTAEDHILSATDLGIGEISITIFGNGYDAPEEVTAGRHLITVINHTAEFAGAAFIQPPTDWTLEQIQEQMSLAGSESAGPDELSWLFTIPIAGGASGNPGETTQAIVDLSPGRWVIWGDDPSSSLPLVEVMVTGEMPTELPPITPDITVAAISTATGYDFAIDGTFQAGSQLVAFTNKTDQPHFIASLLTPVALDDELFMGVMAADEDGTPPAGLTFDPDEITAGPDTTSISAGTTLWKVMTFPAGFATLTCWVPDIANEGIPHAMEGMIEHIEIT